MLDTVWATSRLRRDLPQDAYQECFVVPLPPGDTRLESIVPAFFASAPDGFRTLLALRNLIVRPFGLKTGPLAPPRIAPPFRAGQKLGIFHVYEIGADEIVLGEDDRHLDFRMSLQRLDGPDGPRLALSTWVKPHNRLGRAYWAIVKPVHRRLVPLMGRGTARILARQAA